MTPSSEAEKVKRAYITKRTFITTINIVVFKAIKSMLPVRGLSVISKIIERILKSRLIDHLSYNKLLNRHQSAYCKHHSTETALLYIHNHLINAIESQKNIMPLISWSLCCLCHHRPQHPPPLILVRHPWLCSQLVRVLLVISLHKC